MSFADRQLDLHYRNSVCEIFGTRSLPLAYSTLAPIQARAAIRRKAALKKWIKAGMPLTPTIIAVHPFNIAERRK